MKREKLKRKSVRLPAQKLLDGESRSRFVISNSTMV